MNYRCPHLRSWGKGSLAGLALLLSFFYSFQNLSAQHQVIGLGTRWNDSFREWIVQTENEDVNGTLELRWAFRDEWTEWDFRLGDTIASIQQKWKDDPGLWEVRSLGVTVTARSTWPGNFRSWRLTSGNYSITWQSRYANILEEWELRDDRLGNFEVHTYYERDPRDWVVVDELDPDVPFAMRLAMIFIAVYHSTPKQ